MKNKYIMAALILLLVSGLCSAATPVNIDDFTGTSWVLYGKAQVSASKLGTDSYDGVAYVNFGDDGTSFSIADTGNYTISGTYRVDSTGKLVVTVDQDNVQSFFNDYIQQALDDAEISYDDLEVDVTSAKSTCKVTYSGSTVSLAITISAKAKGIVYYEDDAGNSKVFHGSASFTLSMSGDHPVAGGAPKWASKWDIAAKASLTAKK